ncbi:endoplasmic reticulum membrane-associated RNA degradation protein-like isoform X2 [Dysidea avara]|uniref:endoplasmic reticulum membrane-associated RNA degradation protein-like isoform X2 n=1 Tax=Dysidea avara TaxID=196820 RepID=UPI00331E0CF7
MASALIQSFWCGKQLQKHGQRKSRDDNDDVNPEQGLRSVVAMATDTSLSPRVYELFMNVNHVIQCVDDILDDELTIDCVKLRHHFGVDAVQQLDIVGGARKLHSLAGSVHHKMSSLTIDQFITTYHRLFEWTGLPTVFEDCYRQLLANEIAATHICYLLGAATFERALGDLYLTQSDAQQCPSLLRDLLSTSELKHCLGEELMYCLQCLIGPPTGLNLRNLIWHGFPYPGEIPMQFGHLLLVLVATIGRILLQNKGVWLKHRELLTLSHDDVISGSCDGHGDMTKNDMISLIDQSYFVLPPKRQLWYKAINEYCSGQYHISTPLLLSEMEHSLRRVFVCVNKCPHRLLTAESTQLYTTFDEMMIHRLDDGSTNQLVQELGAPYMEMLLDLLVHPEGPRLRDHISHGEVDVYHISAIMASHVITVAMTLCGRYITPTPHDIIIDYHSLYHPLSILRRELLSLIDALQHLLGHQMTDLHRRDPVQKAVKCVGVAVTEVAEVLQQQLSADVKLPVGVADQQQQLLVGGVANQIKQLSVGVADQQQLVGGAGKASNPLELHQIKTLIQDKWFHWITNTLFVAREVLEWVGLLRRCVHHCYTTILQVDAMLVLRQDQLEKKTLRSRQRTNYELLQERLLVGVVMIQITRYCHHDYNKTIRSLKKVLQFTENFNSQTSANKNRWDVANTLCVEFANKLFSLPALIM